MKPECHIEGGRHEEVITEDNASKEAHKELFRLDDNAYLVVGDRIIDSIKERISSGALRIHLSGSWSWILKVALWKNETPSRGEVFYLLKRFGLSDDDIAPFSSSDINDIFHSLYYGKRFDVLKRLCHRAKKTAEENLKADGVRIHCHLVATEITQIVASSL